MKERPIIFSAPMVRAILDGRKTQTRRVVKVTHRTPGLAAALEPLDPAWARPDVAAELCPYGVPGDRLWVREGFSAVDEQGPGCYVYRADGREDLFSWRSPIHMPRAASRITLEIVGVRVERLQAISPDDAIAEGLKRLSKDGRMVKYGIPDHDGLPGTDDTGWPWHAWRQSPVDAYQSVWESLHGRSSWASNPWVWVIKFRRTK